jgi:dTDP-4-amino-4,6-dideoxygalactose transaminase
MATTDDDRLAERMRVMSLHGISHDAWNRYTEAGNWYYEILAPGFKYNMSDLAAALGLVQLRRAGEFHRKRQAIAAQYTKALAALSGHIETPADANDGGVHSWHLYIIKLRLENLTIDRRAFVEEMKRRNIGCSVHFIPLHIHPYYRDMYGYEPGDFPSAFQTYQRIVSLPLYPKMTDADVDSVVDAITAICKQHGK